MNARLGDAKQYVPLLDGQGLRRKVKGVSDADA
jgi:hypothetical protein